MTALTTTFADIFKMPINTGKKFQIHDILACITENSSYGESAFGADTWLGDDEFIRIETVLHETHNSDDKYAQSLIRVLYLDQPTMVITMSGACNDEPSARIVNLPSFRALSSYLIETYGEETEVGIVKLDDLASELVGGKLALALSYL